MADIPTFTQIADAHARLAPDVLKTPVLSWNSPTKKRLLGEQTQLHLKLEAFQHAGSFKLRAAHLKVANLTPDARAKGIVVGSSGNHGVACALVAAHYGVSCKVVVHEAANPYKLSMIQAHDADVIVVPSGSDIIPTCQQIVANEGRSFLHPFEGWDTVLGTATLGYEMLQQVQGAEVIVVPVGGGGLISGIALAAALINPGAQVYGVEPEGSDVFRQSLTAGRVVTDTTIASIADSLNAPFTADYTFSVAQPRVVGAVTVTSDQIRAAMGMMLEEFHLALEPAATTAFAGALGPLRAQIDGRSTLVIVCGSNIDKLSYARFLEA